jgi:hypothetical protein
VKTWLLYLSIIIGKNRGETMKKEQFVFVLMALIFLMTMGCTLNTVPTVPQIKIPTLKPETGTGTPAPNGQINIPGVSVQINAPGPNPLMDTADAHGVAAGLLPGIWHGIISPITLIVSFFNKDTQIYEVHNNGTQYNLGFLLGVLISFGILSAVIGSRRR